MTHEMLGRGIYDPSEIARLIRVHPETLARWTTGRRALIDPAFGQLFDFEDLVSLLVIAELSRRNVPLREIRKGMEMLAGEFGVKRPFAHTDAPQRLATVGKAFFAQIVDWVDAGKGFQGAFQLMIEPVIKPLEYSSDGMANLWRPLDLVTATPVVQAGTPCVEQTRVPTETLQGLVDAGDTIDDIAFGLDLNADQIMAALRFERALGHRQTDNKVLIG